MENLTFRSKKRKLVFVDDDEFLRKILEIKFKEAGWNVVMLSNANGDFIKIIKKTTKDSTF